MTTRRYGWKKDRPDHRDRLLAVAEADLAGLPAKVDLRGPSMPEPYDQGELGSCTANAIAGAVQHGLRAQGLPDVTPSRLFVYYNERAMEGTVAQDAGARVRDGVKSVARQGVCPEPEWPYDVARFAEKPSDSCYADALKLEALRYARVVQHRPQLKACLAAGRPFVFGFEVFASFESREVAQSGVAPMPGRFERELGGHAVLAVGYDETAQRYLVRNSWGSGWGQGGYFTLPYAYLENPSLASDFWTIETLS